jgi:SOS-response transcriptional repressor LexA
VGWAAAGIPLLAVQHLDGVMLAHSSWAKGEELFFVRLQGEGMMPTFWDGDHLPLRRQAAVENGTLTAMLTWERWWCNVWSGPVTILH